MSKTAEKLNKFCKDLALGEMKIVYIYADGTEYAQKPKSYIDAIQEALKFSEDKVGVKDNTVPNAVKAAHFATLKHQGQMRKFGNEPYINHCFRVALRLRDVGEPAISAALLHDTVEDTPTTYEELEREFGTIIASIVMELTDPPQSVGNRATRKAIVREKLKSASYYAKCVKCADILDNMESIIEHDKNFAKVFMIEIILLLPYLADAEDKLYKELVEKVDKYMKETGIDVVKIDLPKTSGEGSFQYPY